MYKLGLKPSNPDSCLIHLKAISNPDATVLTPQTRLGFTEVGSWPMLGNDKIGDCLIAEAAHIVQFWSRMGPMRIMSDAEAITNYTAMSGYDPEAPLVNGQNPTDTGIVPEDGLNHWVQNGIEIQGKTDQLTGYAAIGVSLQETLEALNLVGIIFAGVNLPSSAIPLLEAGKPWTPQPNDSIEGGHAIPIVGVNGDWLFTVTWGRVWALSTDWWTQYVMCSYALLSKDYTDPRLGVDWNSLKKNMALLSSPQ